MKWFGYGGAAASLAGILWAGVVFAPTGCDVPAKADARIAPESSIDSEPDTSTLLERVNARWEVKCQGDWIQVYDYYSPSFKRERGLYEYLDGKAHHHYKDPTAPTLVSVDGNKAYVETAAHWWTTHPLVVESLPDNGSFEDRLDIVETWEWTGGQWFFVDNERRGEFYARFPDLLKKD